MSNRSGRRGFLKSLAAAPLTLAAQTAAPLPPPAPAPCPPPETRVAEALTEVVRERYGAQLDDSALAEVRKGIESAQQAAARLRGLDLGNADEPVTTFRAVARRPAS